jgi:L-lactate dehydrogenase
MQLPTIAIIGTGHVGSTIAYSFIEHQLAEKLLLVDIDQEHCTGELLDLEDAASLGATTQVISASLRQAAQADIIIIAAGQPQKPGQPRSELLAANSAVVRTCITQMGPINKHARLIMITNPVDPLTYLAQQLSKLPHDQVIGSGTLLDTQRLKQMVAEKCALPLSALTLLVIGEHGEHQVVAWSAAQLAGKPLNLDSATAQQLSNAERTKVYEIIARKGWVEFGIASCVIAYCKALVHDIKLEAPLSCFSPTYQLYMSMPVVLGRTGIESRPVLKLSSQEQKELDASATAIKQALAVLGY